jgi:hypothetical protein
MNTFVRAFSLLVLTFACVDVTAQRVTAYFDYKNAFMVFDDGAFNQIEYTQVGKYKVGGDFIAYMNADNSLKLYYKGETFMLEEAQPQSFDCSLNLCVYKMNRRLMKVENGDKTTLCDWASDYRIGDSIAAFTDYGDPGFKVYYNGQTTALETGVNQGGVKEYKVSANLVAYIDASNDLKVFWHGQTYDMKTKNFSLEYEVGTDMCAFVDRFTNEFKVFYQGDVQVLDQTPPKFMRVNNNSVAYIDASQNFNIFYNGETMFVSGFVTDTTFNAIGNMVVFSLKNDLKIFFKGKIYQLENTKLSNDHFAVKGMYFNNPRNTFVYLDNFGRLKMFDNGTIRPNVTFETPTRVELTNDILVITLGTSTVSVYYKGKTY